MSWLCWIPGLACSGTVSQRALALLIPGGHKCCQDLPAADMQPRSSLGAGVPSLPH